MYHKENFGAHNIKGKICTQTVIREFLNSEENIELIVKPKFLIFSIGKQTKFTPAAGIPKVATLRECQDKNIFEYACSRRYLME